MKPKFNKDDRIKQVRFYTSEPPTTVHGTVIETILIKESAIGIYRIKFDSGEVSDQRFGLYKV